MQLVISDREGNILVNQGDMLLEEEAIAQKLRNNTGESRFNVYDFQEGSGGRESPYPAGT